MRRFLSLTWLLPTVILAAYLFGIWGWSALAPGLGLTWPDILLRGLGSMVVATSYETGPNVITDWRLDTARLLGATAFVLAASRAITKLLSQNASLYAARFRRGHLLVVGDHEVARGVVEAAAVRDEPVTWISGREGAVAPVPGALVIARPWEPRLGDAFGAARARHIIVAVADEVRQVATVRDLRAGAPGVPITMNFADPWFGERMDELENISGVRYVSLTDLALRALHWRHPPFLIARRLGQARLHALIIGFGRAGEAALDDILLSSLTSFQGRPRITIVDPDATEIRVSLAQRCPELDQSVEIVVIEARHHQDARILPWAEIKAAHAECPLTLAYVCLDSDLRALTVAVSLQALVRREGWVMGPICSHLTAGGALPDSVCAWGEGQSAGLLAFGASQDFAGAIGLFDPDADELPRLVHEAYRRVAPGHAVANLPWEKLTEEMRESNRRLIIHLPAKLASAGVDLDDWLDANPARPLHRMPDVVHHRESLESLAELEHLRWMAERRLSGWQHGPVRDELRRTHPDLVPWEKLPEASRRFDREIVSATLEAAARARQGRGAP